MKPRRHEPPRATPCPVRITLRDGSLRAQRSRACPSRRGTAACSLSDAAGVTIQARRGAYAAIALLVALLALGPAAHAQTKTGTAAAEFLNIPVGARATAMGGAFGATANDGTALYWNPAGLTQVDGRRLTVEHAAWLVGIDFNFATFTLPTRFGTVAVGLTSFVTDEMEETTVENQTGTGRTFTAGSYAVSLAYARDLTDRFTMGGTVKLVTERIDDSSANGVALDIGTMFVTPFRGIRLGASIANFGTKMQIGGPLVPIDIDEGQAGNNESVTAVISTDEFDMPLTMRVGLATEVYQRAGTRVTLAVDALNPSASGQYLNLGAEVGLLNDLVMVRGGYQELFLDGSPRSFTLGGGLRYRFGALNLAADYAYEAFDYFNGVNRFTVALGF